MYAMKENTCLKLQVLEEVLVDEPLVGVHLRQGERILEHVANLRKPGSTVQIES